MDKKFDAVKFQRERREKLSKEYLKNSKSFINKLKNKYFLVKDESKISK